MHLQTRLSKRKQEQSDCNGQVVALLGSEKEGALATFEFSQDPFDLTWLAFTRIKEKTIVQLPYKITTHVRFPLTFETMLPSHFI